MQTWYLFSLAALLLLGGQRFLYKVAAAKNCPTFLTTLCFMVTVAVLSSGLLILRPPVIPSMLFLVLISLANSLTFVVATLAHIQALKHMPATVAYPLIRMNIVLVVCFAVLFLQERLAPMQTLGVLLSFATIWVLARDSAPDSEVRAKAKGLPLVFLAMLAGALSAISSKYAAEHTDLLAFIALSYIFSTLFTLGPKLAAVVRGLMRGQELGRAQDTHKKETLAATQDKKSRQQAVIIGLAMGLLNLAGFYLFLKALALGPLAIVASVNGMHFLVAVVLSVLIFKEKLNLNRLLGLILAILAILLLHG
ncbi:DMT family transporter [Desulfonatronum thioautotrophicum]|uniref:DMT family transporter n=1 Tax=Desulfonatronum thioautotrophicum TaxID=617001 RepID=UPI0005EB9101|nr:DMT family transporter [Desulfonatronum thioautotrophicum]